ncbi:MAG: peptidoglycan recognition family protein, partial [Pseudomonadota bacterium]
MIYVDDAGWLISEDPEVRIVRLPTVRTCQLKTSAPLGIVWHWTGGVGGASYAESLCRRIQRYRRGIDRPASWHLLIAKDGTIYQSAPVSVGTWHVGRPGIVAGQRFANVNHATIGVELENSGRLRRISDRYYCWPYLLNSHAPEHEQRPDPRCLVNQARAVRVPGQGIFDSFPTKQ